MNIRSNSSVVNFRPFLLELCPFSNLKYWNYTVFRSFLLHALTYWAEILHMTLIYCTTDHFFNCCQFVSIYVGFMPLLELKLLEIQFSTVFSYMLWYIEPKFCIWLYFTILQITFFKCCQFVSIFVGVMPLLELKILEIHSFPQLSPTCFNILSRNFAYDFAFFVLQIKFECRQFPSILWELCPL